MAYDNTDFEPSRNTFLLEALVRARDIAKKHDHIKGQIYTHQRMSRPIYTYEPSKIAGVCTLGAMLGGLRISITNYDDAEIMFKALGFEYRNEVCEWNNRPETTKDDVVKRFDDAIERATQGGGPG